MRALLKYRENMIRISCVAAKEIKYSTKGKVESLCEKKKETRSSKKKKREHHLCFLRAKIEIDTC